MKHGICILSNLVLVIAFNGNSADYPGVLSLLLDVRDIELNRIDSQFVCMCERQSQVNWQLKPVR